MKTRQPSLFTGIKDAAINLITQPANRDPHYTAYLLVLLKIGQQSVVGGVEALQFQPGNLAASLQLLEVRPGLLALALQAGVPGTLGCGLPGVPVRISQGGLCALLQPS